MNKHQQKHAHTFAAAGSSASFGALPAPALKKPRGFAAMDPQRVREIASMGGRAAHEKGVAHEFSTEEARAAGRRRAYLRAQGT